MCDVARVHIDPDGIDFDDDRLMIKLAAELARSDMPNGDEMAAVERRILLRAVDILDRSYPEMLNSIATADTRISEVLEYYNRVAGRTLRATSTRTRLLKKILKQGYTVAEMKAVIDLKAEQMGIEWEYFRPETLFAQANFDKYDQFIKAKQAAESFEDEGI